MTLIIGIFILAAGVVMLAISVQVATHDRKKFRRNHKITGSFSNAISGVVSSEVKDGEISKGFTIDRRNGELVISSRLSDDNLK